MKIAVVGLKYFGTRICTHLNELDRKNQYIFFDTYYSYKDRLKFLLLLPFIRTVYSINGTIQKSLVISISIFLKKRVVFHWVGSDLIQAKKDFKTNQYNPKFIRKPIHLTDTPWYIDELKSMGIEAQFISLTPIKADDATAAFSQKFSVLTYISQSDPEFYGLSRILEIASELKNVHFFIAGLVKTDKIIPENITLMGWVKNMDEAIANSMVSIRIPEHDGLSSFVLESLKNERYVIYNKAYSHCNFVSDNKSVIDSIRSFVDQFERGVLSPNVEGRAFVVDNFSKKTVVQSLIFALTNKMN
ncbi:MAG: hypothetical protein ACOYOV_07235 [Bacteroidales bacterium]